MGISIKQQIANAVSTRPAPQGVLIPVPRHERYVYCPETDWLFSTKMKQVEYYPMSRIYPCAVNEMFDGFLITDNGIKTKLSIESLRKLKESTCMNLQNSASTNPADYKGKFLIGSIHKQTGAVSFSVNPARQPGRNSAKTEAARLAAQDNTKHFMVVEVTDIATMQNVVFL